MTLSLPIDAGPAQIAQRVVRPLRLATGLILFAYATTHFLNHAFGIRSIEAMQRASVVLLEPWQTPPGLVLLYGSFLTHGALGLYALYRRRHLRMPAGEAWQLALGLAIPLLLIPHAAAIRIGQSFYGLEPNYLRLVHLFWTSPETMIKQYLLLLVLWIHGCIGLRAWLALKPWYPRAAAALASLAVLVPVLALLGFTNALLDIGDAAARNPDLPASYFVAVPGTPAAARVDQVRELAARLAWAYLGLLAGTIALRGVRDWHARRFRAIRVTYPGGRAITVPLGFSVLEASRWARIPHASVCGGRGRCSTCRVRIVEGFEMLPFPGPIERRTLERIGSPPGVRLACQTRPQGDVRVEPLVPLGAASLSNAVRFSAAIAGGTETEVAAVFIDLRESTRLAAGRLPYDTLFIFDRYIQVVTAAVREHHGHVTSIAGDGVMAMFAGRGGGTTFARAAFMAALQLWDGVEALNRDLAPELELPLRIGIGLHVGPAVVGMISAPGAASLQFLGDTGNLAAKLQVETRRLECTLIASSAAVALLAPDRIDANPIALPIAGKGDILVMPFRAHDELKALLAGVPAR